MPEPRLKTPCKWGRHRFLGPLVRPESMPTATISSSRCFNTPYGMLLYVPWMTSKVGLLCVLAHLVKQREGKEREWLHFLETGARDYLSGDIPPMLLYETRNLHAESSTYTLSHEQSRC